MKALDANGDGKLSREESQRSPLFREKQRPGADKFLQSIGANLFLTPKDVQQRFDRYESVVYRQNTAASDSDTAVFELLDDDGNGVVEGQEMIDAVDLLLAKDADDDECVTLDEFAPPVDPTAAQLVNPAATPAKPTGSTVAEILRDTQQTLLPAELIRKYDKNRNSKLSADELGWTAARIAPCDANKDAELTVRELANIRMTPVDIDLAVDVIRPKDEPMLRVLAAGGNRTDGDRVPDLATITLPTAVVTFSTREVDPYETSMAIAMRTFNELDQDNNGYLDRAESMIRERLARVLFDQIDADGDEKIFGEEMKEFIRAQGEPVATTCQVTAYDDGAGFFSALDANGDRRISMREMRYADRTLATMQRDDKPGLGVSEPARRYRIEFVRGVFNPFGTPDRPMNPQMAQMETAAVKPRPVGPIWFQRWDRNNDGDITWREFLGPRDAFEALDTDRDEMLDPREAAAATQLSKRTESTVTGP
jgi:Ca2+-binding EF-hand superfamily protein